MAEAQSGENGLLATARRLLQTITGLLEKRLELFVVEFQEERIRLLTAILLLVVGGICTLMTMVLIAFTLVVVFWEEHRLLVLSLLTIAHAGGALWAFLSLRNRMRQWKAFPATLDQLKKDRVCLETRN